MKIIASLLLTLVTTASLASCASPTGPDTTKGNDSSSGVNLDADVNVDTGGNASGSTSANSSLTIDASGKTYTYGQLKSHYQCVANTSTNPAFKSVAATMVADLNAADNGSEKEATAVYTKAALGVSSLAYANTSCKI